MPFRLPATRRDQARCAGYIFQRETDLFFSSPFSQTIILYCQPWRLELSRSIGPFSSQVSLFAFSGLQAYEILFLLKSGTISRLTRVWVQTNKLSWIQHKNCNNLRSLLYNPYTTKILLNAHPRPCGRWLCSLFLGYT